MGCQNGCFSSRESDDSYSGTLVEGVENEYKAHAYKVVVPTINPHDKVYINNQWAICVFKFQPKGINPFSYIIENNPHVYTKYFEKYKHPEDKTPLKPQENPKYIHHTLVVQKVIRHIVMKVLTENLESTIPYLKRLGALHAEHSVTTPDLYLFEESFMKAQKEYNPMMNPMSKEAWYKLVRFVLRAMTVGITNHNEKTQYIMASNNKKGRFCHCLYPEPKPPTGMDDALLSIKNCAAFLQRED